MTTPRKLTPQEEARLAQVRKKFAERKKLSERLGKIKNSIGVYSGKGGVGKTTVAVNLSVTLAEHGFKVAIFDCDIDCPNVAQIMHITEAPRESNGSLIPSARFGVKVMSMAFFQKHEEEAIIWRGPMIHNAITRFLMITDWGDLDYLIVDLPPGTSDSPLTVMQTIPLNGFVIVTTPQSLALLDAKRSINMIKKMNLKVLGIFENMSGDVWGSGGGRELSEEMNLPFLGNANMSPNYLYANKPVSIKHKQISIEYQALAQKVIQQVNT